MPGADEENLETAVGVIAADRNRFLPGGGCLRGPLGQALPLQNDCFSTAAPI